MPIYGITAKTNLATGTSSLPLHHPSHSLARSTHQFPHVLPLRDLYSRDLLKWLDHSIEHLARLRIRGSRNPRIRLKILYTIHSQNQGSTLSRGLSAEKIGFAWVVITYYLTYIGFAVAGLVITKQVVIKGIRVEDVAKDEQGRAV